LIAAEVDFLMVGGIAVGVHAEPRATDDLDVYIRPTRANARRLQRALRAFGFGASTPSLDRLARPKRVFMIGRKPLRIDILNAIDGVDFARAWAGRIEVELDGVAIPVIGRDELVANKLAAGRPKDISDLALLARSPTRVGGAARGRRATRGRGPSRDRPKRRRS
jgi:hypothetical protein